ncbi:hypothetical protein RBB84_18595 [Rhodococcus sp. D-6]|uniref:Uncharacterized protein n=1 Tax=Rhodococcus sp. D-6 TaxID=1387842 RepID=A0AAU7UU65_9NOCA
MNDLVFSHEGEVAWDGAAEFTIIPGTSSSSTKHQVETWERIVLVGKDIPDFELTWSGDQVATQTRSNLPFGCLYQVRLYLNGNGRADGGGKVEGALNFPSLRKGGKMSERGLISRCQQNPQLSFSPGGTFVAASIATCPPCMARIQLAKNPPILANDLATFDHDSVVASSVSLTANSMNQLYIVDLPRQDTREPLLPGNEYFFVALVWSPNGHWDYVLNLGSQAQPETMTLKRRRLQFRLTDLFIVDDNDDLSEGQADFSISVSEGNDSDSEEWNGVVVDSGKSVPNIPATMRLNFGPSSFSTFSESLVNVDVIGIEDNSGSFPAEGDDIAIASFDDLEFPRGPSEKVTQQTLSLGSHAPSGSFRFIAKVVYSVDYE